MKEIVKVHGTETVALQAELTDEMINWMSVESFDERGGQKWFTIFLYDVIGELLLIVEHYGGEVVIYPQKNVEMNEVRSFFKGNIIVNIS